MALDAEKRPSRALASNQGHLLWAGAVPAERAGRVRDVLMSEAMFSGWGIRTLARGERAYSPVGYHTGSIWPHDNALIAVGLRPYGFDEDFGLTPEGFDRRLRVIRPSLSSAPRCRTGSIAWRSQAYASRGRASICALSDPASR